MVRYKGLLLFLVVFVLDHLEAGHSIRDKIYTTLSGASPCILRTNGTHAFGCTSNFGGNDGIIFMVSNDEDMRWLGSNNGKSYMVVLNQTMFKRDILQKLNTMDHVNGVLYTQTKKVINDFSPESQCPNEYSGLSAPPNNIKTCDKTSRGWNPPGNSLLFSSFKFPIFIVTDPKEISQVENCFRKYNNPINEALCSMRMKSHMFAATDTRLCLRRSMSNFNINPVRYCDPLGDKNLYVPLYPLHLMESVKNRSIIMVGTRLDSTSMFYGLAPGSVSTATSVVTLLYTAQLLFKMLPYDVTQKYDKNVIFVFFQGEAYDYIGSSRIVYDMSQGQFPYKERPITKEQIGLFIDISQITANPNIALHSKEKTTSSTLSNFMKIFKKKCATYNIRPKRINSEFIPPTSMQSFLAADEDLPAFVLSSYDDSFENRFFHSTRDDTENANYQYSNGTTIAEDSLQALITNLSISLASSIYQNIKDVQPESVNDTSYRDVDELLHCYLDTFKCDLLRTIDEHIWNSLIPSPIDYYVGVSMVANSLTSITALALSYLTGVPDPTNPCTNEDYYSPFRYILIKGQNNETCYRTTVNATDATSPAFVIEGYDFASGLYSSWTESVWRDVQVEIYLTHSTPYASFMIITATLVTVFSFFAVYWFNKNVRRLFEDD